MKVTYGSAILAPLAVILGACTDARLERNLENNFAAQEREFHDIFGSFRTEPSKAVTWDAAYKRMMRDNLSLRLSRQQVEDSKKLRKRQWLTLVPRVSSYANVGAGISELSNLSSDDMNVSLLANFNIPNPFEFYAGLYAAALQEQNALWSHELDKRRAYTELYSAFIEGEAISDAEKAYEGRLKAILNQRNGDVAALVKSVAMETQSLKRRRLYQRLSLNQLLNTPGSNWDSTGKLPEISYSERYRNLVSQDGFGKLALNLQAIQIESAILRVQQVKFQEWPTINFGLNNPPIYSSSGSTDFSSDNLQLFSGAYKNFDVTDLGGREKMQDARTRLGFTREQLRQRAESESSRVLQLIESYETLTIEGRHLVRERKRLANVGSSEPEIVLKDLERITQVQIRLIENRKQIQQLDLQFLIWDESFWN